MALFQSGISDRRLVLAGVKHSIRSSAANLLYHCGMLETIKDRRLRGKALVLMYHRVLETNEYAATYSHPSICITTKAFEKQIAYLKNHFNILSVKEFIWHIDQQQPFKPCSVLITFDDGWRDNYQHALPILKRYEVPALIFLASGFIGTDKNFWQERLRQLLWAATVSAQKNLLSAEELVSLFGTWQVRQLMASRGEGRRFQILALTQGLKSKAYKEIETVIERLEKVYQSTFDKSGENSSPAFLTWEQVREMRHLGIDFGSHGVNHLLLDKEEVDVDGEVKNSRIEIEGQIGCGIDTFSYPNGNYNSSIAKRVASFGYRLGFGTEFGYNHLKSNRFALKRVNIFEDATATIPLFLCRILGVW